jgi:hypothetical protein
MVITMSIMPLFTYSNLSLHSHGVITVHRDLQIFLCPTNEGATRVRYATSPDTRTSSVPITLAAAPLHFGAASAEVAFDAAFPRAEDSPPYLP